MKKFRGFIKGSFLNLLAFRFDIWSWIMQDVMNVVILVFLWFAIYVNKANASGADPKEIVINGYTMTQLIGYMIIVTVTTQWVFASNTFRNVGEDIYEGMIAISMTKPINYRRKNLALAFGNLASSFILFFVPVMIMAEIAFFAIFGTPLPAIGESPWYNFLFYILAGFLGFLIVDSLDFLVSLLSFFTHSVFGLIVIKGAIYGFLAGAMIPFSFFPVWAQNILSYLPFAGIASTPVNIFLGRFDLTTTLISLGISGAWAAGLYIISELACAGMLRHVESVGG